MSGVVTTERAPAGRLEHPAWHGMDAAAAAQQFGVDTGKGLSTSEAADRLRTQGPNKLAEAKKESWFKAFVRQYQDFMQIILLVAAIVNALVTDDTGTTILLAGLTVLNAAIGLRQEAKAEESVAALAQMMKTIARVRRDGQAIEVDAQELVPGESCWSRPATGCRPTAGSWSRPRTRHPG
jgi:P-type Ca2+ transporter type 2C